VQDVSGQIRGDIVTEDSSVNSGGEAFHGNELAAALTVNDMQKSLSWYTDVVGFGISQKHEREGNLVAVSMKAGNVRLLLGQDDGAKGSDRIKGQGVSLQITTDEGIDEVANRIKSAGGVLEGEPVTMPWGARMFRIKDPDGFILVISSR
jgi:uncharacterized glyoxalase superfamily protein PhnB